MRDVKYVCDISSEIINDGEELYVLRKCRVESGWLSNVESDGDCIHMSLEEGKEIIKCIKEINE